MYFEMPSRQVTTRPQPNTQHTTRSGHYYPSLREYERLLDNWRSMGLDLSQTEIRTVAKEEV